MKAKRRLLPPAKDILLELFEGDEEALAGFLLRHTYFLSPERIRQRYVKTGTAAWFPTCVRSSREHHKGKQKKDQSTWQGQTVTVCDNTKARGAFALFSGLVMAGDKEGRIRGYHVAHIWERVYDPECFTAGWNLCLMPGFLKLFTEQQDRISLLHQIIQQAAFDLYFKDNTVGFPMPQFVTNPQMDLSARFPSVTLNLL
jgi:hypothetical protein